MLKHKKIFNVTYFALLVMATAAVVMVNPFFGSMFFVVLVAIVLLSSKYFSYISKVIVASFYIAVAVLVIYDATTYSAVYWERDDFEEDEVALQNAEVRFISGLSVKIPEYELVKVKELTSLASSAWWANKWENIIGVERNDLYELVLDSDVARDYKIMVKEKNGEANNIIAVVYKESPDEYKTDKNKYHTLGIYHVPELHAYINNTYNKSSKMDAAKRRGAL